MYIDFLTILRDCLDLAAILVCMCDAYLFSCGVCCLQAVPKVLLTVISLMFISNMAAVDPYRLNYHRLHSP